MDSVVNQIWFARTEVMMKKERKHVITITDAFCSAESKGSITTW